MYSEVYEPAVGSLRYFTVYGPRMRPKMAISNFVSRCMNGKPPVVYGEGTQTREFTIFDDVVGANRTLLGSNAAAGEVLDVGNTDRIEIRELTAVVRDAISPSLDTEFAD